MEQGISLKKKYLFFSFSGVILITIIVKILGFLQSLTLANFFGVNGISDAYLIAQTIPGTIFQFVGMGLTSCFIPFYLSIKKRNLKDAYEFSNRFFSIVVLFSIITIVFVEIFTNQFVFVFASGFKGQTFEYACDFTRICVISVIFSAFNYSYIALLQAEEKQIQSVSVLVPYNIILIISIILAKKISIYFLPIGNILACVIEYVGLKIFIKKLNYKYRVRFCVQDNNIKKMVVSMIPVMIGVVITDINTLVDKTVASNVIVGGITMLTYSLSLFEMVNGIITLPVTNIFYPKITKNIIDSDMQELQVNLKKEISLLIFLLLPITCGICILGEEFVRILFMRGEFSEENARLVADALYMYALGFIIYAFNKLFSQLFYAIGDTKTPLKINSIAVPINILFNLALSKTLGLKGLALATTIANTIVSLALYICIRKRVYIKMKLIKNIVLKCIIAVIVMNIAIYKIKHIFSQPYMRLIVGFVVGSITYFMMLYILEGYKYKKKRK